MFRPNILNAQKLYDVQSASVSLQNMMDGPTSATAPDTNHTLGSGHDLSPTCTLEDQQGLTATAGPELPGPARAGLRASPFKTPSPRRDSAYPLPLDRVGPTPRQGFFMFPPRDP